MSPHAFSLKLRLWATAALALFGSLCLLGVAIFTVNGVKIRGPLYNDIVSYKDLLADILPPPEYLIESYLTCYEAMKASPSEQSQLIAKLQKLETEYRERNAFWQTNLKNAGLRTTMLENATKPAMEFFDTLKGEFLPALRKGDNTAAQVVLDGPLTSYYRKHRAAIDRTVELANKQVEVVEATADATLAARMRTLWIAAIGINVLLLLLTYFSIRSILRPMSSLTTYAKRVSAGDYDCVCDVAASNEIGKLAEVLSATVGKIKDSLAQASESEIRAQDEARNARELSQLAEQEKGKAQTAKRQGMLDAALKLEHVVEVLGAASERLAAQIEQSSRGAQAQAQKAGEVASAMEQMNASVLEVAKSASQSAETSNAARSRANEGEEVVQQVIQGIGGVEEIAGQLKNDMTDLRKQSDNIGQILGVISDIADQTNLLALNAAIEAARAGDAGRGFAVVADEVRKLAEKTMTATRQVEESIHGVQASARANIERVEHAVSSINNATRLAGTSGQALKDIVALVETSAGQVQTIATSAEQQSAASEQINHAVEEVNSVAQESSKAMGDAARAVNDLSHEASALRQLIEDMKHEDGATGTEAA